MKIEVLKYTKEINRPIQEAWTFFSNPNNLKLITPNYLGFEIISDLPEEMYEGMLISYKVRPLLNVPISWVTEITNVKNLDYFIDEQRFGPYKIWHHEHFFKSIDNNKTLMTDIIHYSLPNIPFNSLINRLIVKKRVENIFSYRESIIDRIFSER